MPSTPYGDDAQPEAEDGAGDRHPGRRKLENVAHHYDGGAEECSNRVQLGA
jgi:hypothetical protein